MKKVKIQTSKKQQQSNFSSKQDPAWKTHVWKKGRDKKSTLKKPRRKFHFKQIARWV